MRFEAAQHMRLGQQMRLAPRMIQSMEILQMPLLQLEERIALELESNPTLELTEVEPDSDGAGNTEDGEEGDFEGSSDASSDGDEGQESDADASEGSDFADDIGASDESRSADERPMQVDATHGEADFERLERFEGDNPDVIENQYSESAPSDVADVADRPAASVLDGERDAKSDALNNTASRSASLAEQLQEQWLLADMDESLRGPGEQIIAFIEDDGYLRTPLETIRERMPVEPGAERPDLARMERALHAVQLLLDPPGVAARDTRECLLLQVDGLIEMPGLTPEDRSSWALVRRLIEEHLEDLAQNRLPRIVEKAGVPISEIKHAMEKMRLLSLAPGRQLVNESPGLIVPDAIVEYDADQDRYIAYLNESRLPNLRINQEYATLSKDKAAAKDTREFLKKNLSNAAWLIDAVEQRRRTLLRVIRVVVDAQREYFDYGPQSLKPLPMTQVAEQLGVHVATVSRAVSDKHLLTPRGVVPLRGFFSGGTQTQSGEDVSWDAIKAALKEIIDAEDKSSPLSDDALCAELDKRGIAIARRTVAKYRDQLQVAPARLRKKF